MGEVVSLAAHKQENSPHWAGEAKCVGCQHEWTAVAPLGVLWLDCPACELPKGHPKHPFGAQEGDLLFECLCGAEALTAYKRNGRFWLRCMGCDVDQTQAVFGE